MKLHRSVLLVIGGLAVVAAGLGGLAGARSGVSETQVIDAAAKLWAAETGGVLTSCVGVPGSGAVWIEVRCDDGAVSRTYLFDERGKRLAPSKEPRA